MVADLILLSGIPSVHREGFKLCFRRVSLGVKVRKSCDSVSQCCWGRDKRPEGEESVAARGVVVGRPDAAARRCDAPPHVVGCGVAESLHDVGFAARTVGIMMKMVVADEGELHAVPEAAHSCDLSPSPMKKKTIFLPS
ncbi:PIG-L family deacetylase [Sesbania bispinosa]|nr:PIG-L family deacetylase [Sesbania bispinosa]